MKHLGPRRFGKVVKVTRGDTLAVLLEPGLNVWSRDTYRAELAKVRLAEIVAPKLREPQGRAARRLLARLVLGREIVAFVEPEGLGTWLVASLYLKEPLEGIERSIEGYMLRSGLVREAPKVRDPRTEDGPTR